MKIIMLYTKCIDIFMYYVYFIPCSPKYITIPMYNEQGRKTIIGSTYNEKNIVNVYKTKTKYKFEFIN